MPIVDKLLAYSDDNGNTIEYEGKQPTGSVKIEFSGKNNRLIIGQDSTMALLHARFMSDGATCVLGHVGFAPGHVSGRFTMYLSLGKNCHVKIGDHMTTTGSASITAVETDSQVNIGKDCMLASTVRISTTDWHPYYDVKSGRRLNTARPITLGDHIWLGDEVYILGGATIGSGSIIGLRSVVKSRIPNNCTAAGLPAKVLRRDVAWERTPAYYEDHKGLGPHWLLTEIPSDATEGTRSPFSENSLSDYSSIWTGFIVQNGKSFEVGHTKIIFNDLLDRNFLQLFIEGAHWEVHYELALTPQNTLKIALHSEFKNESRDQEMLSSIYANTDRLKKKIDEEFPCLPYNLSKVKNASKKGLQIELPFSFGALHQYNRLLKFFIHITCEYLERAFIKTNNL